tara:strand:- start:370 stop:1140 length:771 start_codon:yes stop_codon:yes gene_type:complete
MKVIILAGGWGTRMGALSEFTPKPMVTVGSQPIIWHIMNIYASYGFKDFIIATGVKGNSIKNYFLNFKEMTNDFTIDSGSNKIIYHDNNNVDWNITIADTGINTLKGGRIKRIEKYIDDEVNLLTYGDGVADIDIGKLVQFHRNHGKTVTFTGVHPSGRFGEFKEDNCLVTDFNEKPDKQRSYINGGFMVFNKNLFDHIGKDENCDFEIGVLDKLALQKEVMVYKHEGQWACMDHERDVVHLNHLWNTNSAFWKNW